MLTVSYVDGYTSIKISDPSFWDHLALVKKIDGRKYANGLWQVVPQEFDKFVSSFPADQVKYSDPEWKCRGQVAPTLTDRYGVPINDIGRELINPNTVDPKDYQDVGACFMYYHGRTILADEVGIGKTIECFLFLTKGIVLGKFRRGGHILVLTKKSLVYNFTKEVKTKTKLTALSVRGEPQVRQSLWQQVAGYDVIVAGHEQIRIEDLDFQFMMDMDLDVIVVDEAHKFNNRGSLLSKQLDKLTTKYKKSSLALMTATPATNDVISNTYDMMRYVDKNVLGPVKDFEKKYIKVSKCYKQNGGTFWKRTPRKELYHEIHAKVSPYLLERKCADVGLKKPECIFTTQYIEMTADQIRLTEEAWKSMEYYDNLAQQMKDAGEASIKIEQVMNKQRSLFTFLRLVADGMALLKDHPTYGSRLQGVSSWRTPKLELLEDIIPEMMSESKVVMHTDFETNFAIVVPFLEKLTKTKVLTISGTMPTSCSKPEEVACGTCDRQNRCSTRRLKEWMFQNDDRFRIILMTSAGEEGLNFQMAKYQVNYDMPWSPKSLTQRVGRINRYGSEHEIQYTADMVSIDSIEEMIVDKIISRKAADIEQIIRSKPDEIAYYKLLASRD